MPTPERLQFHDLDEDAVVRTILEGTATQTGESFFAALVENLSKALNTQSAWVTEFVEKSRQLRALAFWADGELIPGFEIDIDGTPCEEVVENSRLVHYPDNVFELFPDNDNIKKFRSVSYMGVPLLDLKGKVIGNLAVLDNRPMPEEPRSLAIFQIFAARASAELQRLHADAEIKKREEKYRRIVETAAEGFLLMDENCVITDLNEAFCKLVGYSREDIIGKTLFDFSQAGNQRQPMANPESAPAVDNSEFEGIFVTKSGRPVPVLMHRSTLRDDKGATIGSTAENHWRLPGRSRKIFCPTKAPGFRVLISRGAMKHVTKSAGTISIFSGDWNASITISMRLWGMSPATVLRPLF
ncbi:MAG: PAS domain S-box protein [Desulfobacterales bacterium]